MFEKIRFAILCVTSVLAMAATAETPGGDLSARLYFNFEGQEFCLSVAGKRVEALTIHHGRVQRRGIGNVSSEFTSALKALHDVRPRGAPREVLSDRAFRGSA